MNVGRLRVAQLRAFDEAEFEFRPGLNLLVGINGVGKSTVLDALRILLSQVLSELVAIRDRTLRLDFASDDTKVGRDFFSTEVSCEIDGTSFSYLVHKPREEFQLNPEAKEGQVREQTIDTPERREWTFDPAAQMDESKLARQLRRAREQPLAVYFSPHRSLLETEAPTRQSARGGVSAALAKALEPRRLYLPEFAEWWLTREVLAGEGLESARIQLDALGESVTAFLDSYSNLRAVSEPKPGLRVDKGGMTLDVSKLSDGERSVLALVLDLTRRLSQANEGMDDPARQGKAVVLIDELDIHLHPKLQRTIVSRLERTFPNCQFIATSHSPQIIGEMKPDKILIIESSGEVSRPAQSFGMDTNWVLQAIMDADERDPETKQRLVTSFGMIQRGELDEAEREINELRQKMFGSSEELQRASAMIQRIRLMGR
jgi:predicted ATP-binding protein involved in virulence